MRHHTHTTECLIKCYFSEGFFGIGRLIDPNMTGQSKDDEDGITDEEDNIDVEVKDDQAEEEASISRASSKTQFANFSGQH